jgi:hypothetical protein
MPRARAGALVPHAALGPMATPPVPAGVPAAVAPRFTGETGVKAR